MHPVKYFGFGLTILSEFQLLDLAPSTGTPDVEVRAGSVPESVGAPTLLEEAFLDPASARFRVRNGDEIVVDALHEAGHDRCDVQIRRAVLGPAMAILLRQRGWLSLHASAVLVNETAVLFLGWSGTGKSTTAAAFHARGFAMVADDLAAVQARGDRCWLCPGLGWVRLRSDVHGLLENFTGSSYDHRGKRGFDLRAGTAKTLAPVSRIYLLEEGDEPGTRPLSPMEAVAIITRHTQLRAGIAPKEVLAQHVARTAAVVQVTTVHRLTRPQSLNRLPDLVNLVVNDVTREPFLASARR